MAKRLVATVFDLMVANYGLDRGLGGEGRIRLRRPMPFTPGLAGGSDRRAAQRRSIARGTPVRPTPEKTKGRSMVILGAGLNHWYHMDMAYRGIINMLVLCGCIGQSGGGWSHYVGQEKLRPQTGWLPLAFALDWNRPPRHMNSTSLLLRPHRPVEVREAHVGEILSPTRRSGALERRLIDYNVRAERMGWLPSAPQLETEPAARSRKPQPAAGVRAGRLRRSRRLKSRRAPCPATTRTTRRTGRAICSSGAPTCWARRGKGHEYFLKHLLGAKNGVLGEDLGAEGRGKPTEVTWHESAPEGKLDLLVTIDFRMTTTCCSPTSCCRPRPGTRRTTSTPPTCTRSSIR